MCMCVHIYVYMYRYVYIYIRRTYIFGTSKGWCHQCSILTCMPLVIFSPCCAVGSPFAKQPLPRLSQHSGLGALPFYALTVDAFSVQGFKVQGQFGCTEETVSTMTLLCSVTIYRQDSGVWGLKMKILSAHAPQA